jgi:transcriptional regulator with XRE-family HTH domain
MDDMSTIVDEFDARLGARVRSERKLRSWSLNELAERSGVSRAMINKVERGLSSPTASLLGRLSGAFGVTLSALLAGAEPTSRGRLVRSAEQACWRDPATGYFRRQVAPGVGSDLPLELVEIELPPGASAGFPAAAYTFVRQLIWVLKGQLAFEEGALSHRLAVGDCLELGPPRDCTFHNPGKSPCRYLVTVLRRPSS